uniref:U1-type domain-containing protein n=1 Tax=Odontella aurita TaxID=265563 RepID=A0A7S4KBP1_9STRA|mmetsp:Transcript_8894/g.26654  ORF Transcript_8894/g.26654 Transcript_8894/m.26654 type:complete len:503 (+) Transcript_8894:380-1888(+)
MSSSYQNQRRRAPWENNERHYCALCNAWMGSDRQSILIHENGKKHREKAEEDIQRRRLEKVQREKDDASQADALRRIEEAARSAHAADVGSGGAFCRPVSSAGGAAADPAPTAIPSYYPAVGPSAASHPASVPLTAFAAAPPPAPSPAVPAPKPGRGGGKDQRSDPPSSSSSELDSWLARKKKREDARFGNDEGGVADGSEGSSGARKRRKVQLGEDEGHYSIGGATYLEGSAYATILSEEVPAQIWTGSASASDAEKRSVHQQRHWKAGLVVKVRREADVGPSDGDDREDIAERVTCDIAFLRDPSDEDETLERSVRPDRIRIVLGSDDALPNTVEEARLELMGGEEEVLQDGGADGVSGASAEIEENTGLSSWGTVSVRRVTASRDVKEERARLRAKRREEAELEKEKERELAGRKMEEARHANADDSALGSFDVWSGGKSGYKGVNIHSESKLEVADTAKSLAKGKVAVQFKKKPGGSSKFKKAKKKQNRRVTSADDDD